MQLMNDWGDQVSMFFGFEKIEIGEGLNNHTYQFDDSISQLCIRRRGVNAFCPDAMISQKLVESI